MNLQNRTIAVIGLVYVGLPLAVEFGKKRPAIGFDIEVDRVEELKTGHDHTLELSEQDLCEAKCLPHERRGSSSRRFSREKVSCVASHGGGEAKGPWYVYRFDSLRKK